ncbi:MAG: MFS transporter [Candidatus Bathyarchaeota archaeon]|nr:MFS transporter [Candidatus Bathyarchaeota archaeon]
MEHFRLGAIKRSMFFSLSTFQILRFVRWGIFYSFMYIYLYGLMGTVTLTALLGTFNMVASTLGQNLIWGRISDKHKSRIELVVVGESLAGFFYIGIFYIHKYLLGAANNFSAGLALIFGLSILEFFWSMSDVGWAALLTDVTTPDVRGSTVGVLNFIGSAGRMFGIGAAGFLYNNGAGFSEGTIFYVASVMLFAGSVVMLVTSKFKKPISSKIKPKTEVAQEVEDKKQSYRWFFASLAVVVLGATSINQVFLIFLRLPEGLNANDPELSLILAMWTIGGMIASILSGRLADKIGKAEVLLYGFAMATGIPLLYGVMPNVISMALIYGLSGVASWMIQTVGFALAGDIIPSTHRGRLFSVYNAIMSLAWGPAGLLIGGPLADVQTEILRMPRHSAYVNTFAISSIIVLAGTILFLIKVKKQHT